ncbi:MAG: hypothetical protein IT270_12840 [Saprospiraceae bacterium]|nr:hypothetical protein [Saprospiraceae bacterium]
MKKVILLLVSLAIGYLATAQDQFTGAMGAALGQMGAAQKSDDFVACANTFNRIAAAEPEQWLPGYYASYNMLIAGFIASEKDMAKAQGYMDEAQKLLNQTTSRVKQIEDMSEIATLQAYIYTGKVIEDPMTLGQQLSPKVFQELGKAIGMNPNNPRAHYIKGMYTFNMPDFYGGGAANAKPILEKAKALYDAQPAAMTLNPTWGKEQNEELLKSIK